MDEVGATREEGGTYDRHDVILDRLRHGDNLHEYREVDLSHVSIQSSSSFLCSTLRELPYGGQEHRNADSLLSACHLGGDLFLRFERVYVGQVVRG
jgi:hypothetical protein